MAIRLDAAADTLSRTTNLPTITSFSCLGWFYISVTPSTYNQFFAYGNSTTGSGAFYCYGNLNSGSLAFSTIYNGSTQVSGASLPLTTWMHCALTCAGTGAGQLLAYRNGALDVTQAGNSGVAGQKLWVGGDNQSPNEWLNGRMAAIKIYSAVLTAAEIVNEMYYYTPLRWTNLNAWYPCIEPVAADNAKDFGGTAANLTTAGTLTVEDGPPIAWAPASDDWGHMAYDDVAPSVWVPRPLVVSQALERAAIF